MGIKQRVRRAICVAAVVCVLTPAVAGAMTISGTVVDGQTGEPLEGIEVRAYLAEDAWNDDAHYPTGYSGWNATTDATGTYSIEGLESEPYVVGFCDLGNTYRDLSWPQRGLPLTHAYAVPPDYEFPVDARLFPYQYVIDSRVERIAGANRYRTAMEIVRSNFLSADVAVLVSGEDFPDALSATPLAGIYEAPLLLTEKDSLPSGLTALLDDLGVTEIIIVGGEAVVSPAVVEQLNAAGFDRVDRIAGASRYGTSAKVAKLVYAATGWFPFVCRGDAFPDALAAGPYAYNVGMPILLTKPDELPSEVRTVWSDISLFGNNWALVVGGTNAVSDDVVQDLADSSSTDGGVNYVRFAGSDRYETAKLLVAELFHSYDVYGLATGKNFPDALAGGAAIGYNAGALLLTEPERLNPHAAAYLSEDRAEAIWLEVFGGTAAVKDTVMDAAYAKLGNVFRDFDQKKIVSRGTVTKVPFTTSLGACDIGVAAIGVDAAGPAVSSAVDGSAGLDLMSLDWRTRN